jgi:hypothetical protein
MPIRRLVPLLLLAATLLAVVLPSPVQGSPAEAQASQGVSNAKASSATVRTCARRLGRRRAKRACRAPARKTPKPSWVGGYEGGTFAQWDQLNGNLARRDRYFRTLTRPAPVFEGKHSFESVVDAGATQAGEAGQRSMVLLFPSHATVAHENRTGGFEGNERWYRTHVYFPKSFQASPNNGWNWILQWHNWPDGPCCPNLSLAVDTTGGGERLSMRAMGGGDAAHPVEKDPVIFERNPTGQLEWFVGDPALRRNHWYDVLVHVKWSYEHSKGLVEWWLDGRRIMSRRMSTLYWYADNDTLPGQTPGPGQTYYMEGYYRPARLPDGSVDQSVASVIYDGARIGPTAGSVG